VEWNLQSWLRRHINGLAGPFSGTACGALPCGMAMISRGILFHHDASRHGSLPALGGQPYVLLTQDDDSRRPLPDEVDLTDLYSLHLERTVGEDGTFPFLGGRWRWTGHSSATVCIGGVCPRSTCGGCKAAAKSGTSC
jgi:hypothetical protein